MKFETRDGDLILHAANGDPLLKLQAAGSFMVVNGGSHILDSRAERLSTEALEAVREWCEKALEGAAA